MLGRVVAGTMASLGLLCATVAWTGWVYLHTVGDPRRTEEIATAVLDSPEARAEIAAVLTEQIVERTGIPAETTPAVSTAVEDVLADPRIAGNLIDAFGSEHARALGVDDPRPTTVDTQGIVTAAQEHLAVADPSIAAAMQAALAGVEIAPLELPDLHTDWAGRLREVADTVTTSLAIVAVALLIAAFVVGDRRHIVRRFGTWAVVSGIGWLIGPYLVAAVAKQLSDFDATIDAVRGAVQAPVITGAIVLVALGVLALIAWVMPVWGGPTRTTSAGGAVRDPGSRRGERPTRRPAVAPAAPAAPRTSAPADTFVWSGQQPTTPQRSHAQATVQQPAHLQPTFQQPTFQQPATPSPSSTPGPPTEAIWGATWPSAGAPAPVANDQDPWSIYFGEGQREK